MRIRRIGYTAGSRFRRIARFRFVCRSEHEPDKTAERRKIQLTARVQLLFVKFLYTAAACQGNRVPLRIVGLHDNFAVGKKSSRSSCNLYDKREGALGRSEVGQMQSRVRHNHADKPYAGKIQALCDHLRSEQNIGFFFFKQRKFFFKIAAAG